MSRNIYGLDLGSYEIKVYDKKQKTIWREKNAIAFADEKEIFAVGDEAYEMYGKTPDHIRVVFPMKEGVISGITDMQYLLQNLLKRGHQFAYGSEYVIAVPTDVTELEKRAFCDLVLHSTARAKSVRIVARVIADAVGAGIAVEREPGIFLVNFGASTMELSVLSYGGIVLNRLLKIGGMHLDREIIQLVKNRYQILISGRTAEFLRKEAGLFPNRQESIYQVPCKKLGTGLPKYKEIPGTLVKTALREPLSDCVKEMTALLKRTPPEVRQAIEQKGIFLTGGMASLSGLDRYLSHAGGWKVTVANQPAICAVRGLEKIIHNKNLHKLTYEMSVENDRWIR